MSTTDLQIGESALRGILENNWSKESILTLIVEAKEGKDCEEIAKELDKTPKSVDSMARAILYLNQLAYELLGDDFHLEILVNALYQLCRVTKDEIRYLKNIAEGFLTAKSNKYLVN